MFLHINCPEREYYELVDPLGGVARGGPTPPLALISQHWSIMMVPQIKNAREALDKIREGDPNIGYYTSEVRKQLASLDPYVISLESHIKTLTDQLEIERKG